MRVAPDSKMDEITELGSHFNELLDALQAGEAAKEKAQQATADEAARRRALFEHERDGLVVLNEDGSVFEANPAFLAMIGYDADELRRLHIRDWDTRYGNGVGQACTHMPAQGVELMETAHLRKDGTTYDAEVSMSRVEWGGRNFYLLINRDITERKRYEREIKEAQAAAESANRAKSDFLAIMSHEIRTPMNGIIGMSQIMGLTGLTLEQRECLDVIRTCSNNLLSLINDVLDLSKIEAGKIELEERDFSLRATISDVVRTQIPLIHDKGLGTHTDIPPTVPDNLSGDQLRLKQILLNLLSNAIKFTHEGSISISVEVTERNDDTVLLTFSVTDTGIGISPDALRKIFEPFTQADASTTRMYGGTGLGLSICGRLSELMGGCLWAESTEGVGSSFFLQVPFSIAETFVDRSERGPGGRKFWDGPPLRILVVDDLELNLKVASRILQATGHFAATARSGLEALRKWEGETFDAILMDIQLPDMNGSEVARAIRERESGSGGHIPIIALTAHALREEREEIIGQDFDGYVAKPLVTDSLFSEIRRCLPADGKQGIREQQPPPPHPEYTAAPVNRIKIAPLLEEIELLLQNSNMEVNEKVSVLRQITPGTVSMDALQFHVEKCNYDQALTCLPEIYRAFGISR